MAETLQKLVDLIVPVNKEWKLVLVKKNGQEETSNIARTKT
jgi:hypothetical protein